MTLNWTNLYSERWADLLHPSAVAHPAKYNHGLIRKIYDYALEMGYIHPGGSVADPFGGVGLGAFYAAMNGIDWTGCELEPAFHISGHRNFEKWIDKFWCACGWEDYLSTLRDWLTSKDEPKPVEDTPQVSMFELIEPPQLDSTALWTRLLELVQLQRVEAINRRSVEGQFCAGCGKVIAPYPVLLQGDSRFLSSILGQVGAVVSSPPFNDGGMGDARPFGGLKQPKAHWNEVSKTGGSTDYGQSPGQLGSMPAGEYDAIISSSAYGSGEKGHPSLGSVNQDNWGNEGTNIAGRRGKDGNYGNSDSQLANLPDTGYDMAISSPPYDEGLGHKVKKVRDIDVQKGLLSLAQASYGDEEGQLGNLPSGEYDAVISSSPFANSLGSDNPDRRGGLLASDPKRRNDANLTGTYGGDEANLGTMAEGEYDAIIGSPPFADSLESKDRDFQAKARPGRTIQCADYGNSDGQLGSLPDKDYDLIVSSPSWAGNLGGQGDASRNAIDPGLFDRHQGGMKRGTGDGTEGNIDHMAEGDYSAVIGSPPFEDTKTFQDSTFEHVDSRPGRQGTKWEKFTAGQTNSGQGYGQTPNQLGNQSGPTFWAASKDILLETHKVLKRGGYTFWVTKQYIKAGRVVDFPDMWKRLCEVCGFEHVETILAWQTEDKGTQVNLEGEAEQKVVSRKSFFRTLYEKKYPENSIDFETVLVLRKL